MGSINSLIASGIHAPEVPTLDEARAKQMTLANMAQQQQIGAQQLASGSVDLEQKKIAARDEELMRQNYMESGGDMGKFQELNMKRGVSAGKQQAVALQNMKLMQERATLTKTDNENLVARHEQAAGELKAILNDPNTANRAVNYSSTLARLKAQGKLTDAEIQGAETYTNDNDLKTHIAGLLTSSAASKEALDAATATRNAAEGAKAMESNAREAALQPFKVSEAKSTAATKARTDASAQLATAKTPDQYAQILNELPHGVANQFPTPDKFDPKTTPGIVRQLGMSPDQQATTTQAAASAAETARHNKTDEGLSGGRLAVERGRLGVEQQRYGFEAGGGVSDAAKMAAEGKISPQLLRSMMRANPGLVNQIRQVDPNFDEANIENRYNTLKEFTSTSNVKAGGQALALNTLIHHADLYMQTAEALKNGSFKPGNAVYNAVADAFGSAPPTNAALVARFFAGETGKVATGGVPAEGEIKGILGNLSTSAGPDQIAGAGKTLLKIAAGRATPLMERAKNAKIDNVIQVLGPEAKGILARRGFNPDTMKPADTAPAAGYVRQAQGPNGHMIGQKPDGGWYDIQNGKKVQ